MCYDFGRLAPRNSGHHGCVGGSERRDRGRHGGGEQATPSPLSLAAPSPVTRPESATAWAIHGGPRSRR